VTYAGENGKIYQFHKERVLPEVESTAREDLQRYIEHEFCESDLLEFSSSKSVPLAKLRSGSFKVLVTDTSTLQPTGDDDQM